MNLRRAIHACDFGELFAGHGAREGVLALVRRYNPVRRARSFVGFSWKQLYAV
jgi:hypothetical protein